METTQTVSAIDRHRQRQAFDRHLLDVIEEEVAIARLRGDVGEMSTVSLGRWFYDEPAHLVEADDEIRRARALEWLRVHTRLVAAIAKRMGHDGPVDKTSSDTSYGVEVFIGTFPLATFVGATVPSNLTCEMVEVGTETLPAVPARTVPRFERRCPESIFAGIESEVSV